MMQSVDKWERWKAIASILSVMATPIVLAIVGNSIQKQLANDGLKKDYVSIAASILKENPEGQEPELRKWAVDVLDSNSPIPFTKNAKLGLEHGVIPGPFLFPPPEECMTSPKELNPDHAIPVEKEAEVARALLECMQSWAQISMEADEVWRKKIGAPDRRSAYDEIKSRHKENASLSRDKKVEPSPNPRQ